MISCQKKSPGLSRLQLYCRSLAVLCRRSFRKLCILQQLSSIRGQASSLQWPVFSGESHLKRDSCTDARWRTVKTLGCSFLLLGLLATSKVEQQQLSVHLCWERLFLEANTLVACMLEARSCHAFYMFQRIVVASSSSSFFIIEGLPDLLLGSDDVSNIYNLDFNKNIEKDFV